MMPADAVRIDYVAPVQCPSADDFQSEVSDRAPHARFADAASASSRARTLVVRIAARRGGYHGSLVVREIDGSESTRSVDASTCAQLVTGLALIAAVAVDASATESSASGSTNASATGGTSTSANGNTASTANGASTTSTPDGKGANAAPQNPAEKKTDSQSNKSPPEEKKNADERSDEPEKDHAQTTPSAPHAFEFSLGIDGGLVGGMSPSVLPTLPVFVEIGRGAGHGIFSPSVRARFERPGGDADSSSQGSAHFTWTEGSVDLCPIAYEPITRVRLVPCVRAEAGIVDASGSGATPTREETRPWAFLGLVARGRVTIVGPLFAEIEGDFGAPLVRDRFYLEPDFTVFRASAVAWSGAAGLGVTIW